jgi:hypothetical protein
LPYDGQPFADLESIFGWLGDGGSEEQHGVTILRHTRPLQNRALARAATDDHTQVMRISQIGQRKMDLPVERLGLRHDQQDAITGGERLENALYSLCRPVDLQHREEVIRRHERIERIRRAEVIQSGQERCGTYTEKGEQDTSDQYANQVSHW